MFRSVATAVATMQGLRNKVAPLQAAGVFVRSTSLCMFFEKCGRARHCLNSTYFILLIFLVDVDDQIILDQYAQYLTAADDKTKKLFYTMIQERFHNTKTKWDDPIFTV